MHMLEQLLNEFCWIDDIHPDNAVRHDIFRVAAWFSDLKLIPVVMDLDVVKPSMVDDSSDPMKRLLSYPIHISMVPLN